MKRFENRTVIVTGASRGMGASHARGFVIEGAHVVIAARSRQEGQMLADGLCDHAIFSRFNVTSDRDWEKTVAAAENALRSGLRAGKQRGHHSFRIDRGDRAGGLGPGDRPTPI